MQISTLNHSYTNNRYLTAGKGAQAYLPNAHKVKTLTNCQPNIQFGLWGNKKKNKPFKKKSEFGSMAKQFGKRLFQNIVTAPVRALSYLAVWNIGKGIKAVKETHQDLKRLKETDPKQRTKRAIKNLIDLALDGFMIFATLGIWAIAMAVFPDTIVNNDYLNAFLTSYQKPVTQKFMNLFKWNYDKSSLFRGYD